MSDVRRLCVDPTMRQVVGRRASQREKRNASSRELGRFEMEMLASRSPSITPRRNDDDAGVLGEADGRIERFDQAVLDDAGDGERVP